MKLGKEDQINLLKKAHLCDPNNVRLCNEYLKTAEKSSDIQQALFFFEQLIYSNKDLSWQENPLSRNESNCPDWLAYLSCCYTSSQISRAEHLFQYMHKKSKLLKKTIFFCEALGSLAYIQKVKSSTGCFEYYLYEPRRDIITQALPISSEDIIKIERSLKNNFQRQYDPQGKATKNGYQISLPPYQPHPVKSFNYNKHECQFLSLNFPCPHIANLLTLISKEVEAYAELVVDLNHPTIRHPLKHYVLSSWTVVINKNGYESVHMHPFGLISGVFYIKTSKEENNSQAGYLEIGSTPEQLGADLEIVRIKPVSGKLVLFPSYYYHRTIPTVSNEERISFAFDVVLKKDY